MSSTTAPVDLRNRLNQEWETRFGHCTRSFGALGVTTPNEILTRITGSASVEQDRILHALIEMAQAGNTDAGRVVWQSMLPVVVRMSKRVHTLGDFGESDKVSYAVGEAWEVINSYPLRRTTKVRANLSMELLHRLTLTSQNQKHIEGHTMTTTDEQLENIVGAGEPQPVSAESRLIHLFSWALEARVIDRAGIALLSRVALGEESTKEIAADLGVQLKCLEKRVERIRAKLSDAVRREVTLDPR